MKVDQVWFPQDGATCRTVQETKRRLMSHFLVVPIGRPDHPIQRSWTISMGFFEVRGLCKQEYMH